MEKFYNKVDPKSLAKFTGKFLCWSLFDKVYNIKKETPTKVFPENFVKFLNTFTEDLRRLLLAIPQF